MSIWGITAFFNPTASPVRVDNFKRFARGVRAQGLKLMAVELSYSGMPSISRAWCDQLITYEAGAVCWQKERLLDEGRKRLPSDCDKVVWLDGDVIFDRADWVAEADRLLDQAPVIQPFEFVYDGENTHGSMSSFGKEGNQIFGHAGFAWGARRELLDRHCFYDASIVGGGAVVMGWANYGLTWPGNLDPRAYFSPAHLEHIREWSRGWFADVKADVGTVEGRVIHLPHGPLALRNWLGRMQILKVNNYRPAEDVRKDGPWFWNSDKPAMHRQIVQYFQSREVERAVLAC